MNITLNTFIQICTYFTVVCVATGWMIKIVKSARKPVDDIDDKLERDYNRLNQHEKDMKKIESDMNYLKDALKLLLENDKVMLEHMRTNNATGKINDRETATFRFLNEHQQ